MTEHDPNRDLDAWLNTLQDPQPSARLQRAIAEIPLRHAHRHDLKPWWPFGNVWKGVAVGSLICALGVVAGAATVDDAAVMTESVATDNTWSEGGLDLAFALPLDEELTP